MKYLNVFFICLFLVGIATRYSFDIGLDTGIWAFPSLVAGAYFFLVNVRYRKFIYGFGYIVLHLLLILFLFFDSFRFKFSLIVFGMIGYTLFMNYSFFFEVKKYSIQTIEKFILWAIYLIIALAFLEITTPLNSFFQGIRDVLYPTGYYVNVDRDIIEHGGVRPTLFLQEPSFLAFILILLLTTGLGISEKENKYIKFGFLWLLSLTIVRSPVMILYLFVLVITYFTLDNAKKINFFNVLKYLFIVAIITYPSLLLMDLFLGERIQQILQVQGLSNIARIYLPVYMFFEMVQVNPLFGFGPANYFELNVRLDNIISHLKIPYLKYSTVEHLLKNASIEHWIYFGLMGGSLVLLIYKGFAKYFNAKNFVYIVGITFLLGNGISSYEDPRFWIVLFSAVLVSAKRNEKIQQLKFS